MGLFVNLHKNEHLPAGVLFILLSLSIIWTLNIRIPEAIGQDLHQPVRVRIFTLRNITAQRAKEYLSLSDVADTVVAIPGTSAISVTGNPEQLVYVSTVLKLVDAVEGYDVQRFDIQPGNILPESEEIALKLGREYSVGTLLDGPSSDGIIKAIACIHKDKLLVISPQGHSQKITETVQQMLSAEGMQTAADTNDVDISKHAEVTISPETTIFISAVEPEIAEKVVFTEEPVIIEANGLKVTSEAVDGGRKESMRTEDDMLGGFLNELTASAAAEKEINMVKAQPAKIERTVSAESARQRYTLRSTEGSRRAEITEQEPVTEESTVKLEPETHKIQPSIIPEQKTVEAQPPADELIEEDIPVVPEIDIPNGDEILELNLPEKVEIVALIDLVGKYLGLNYLYDETKIRGTVTIKVQGRLRVRELYDLLESVLKFRGFVMSRKGKLVTIAPATEIMEQDPTFAEGMKAGDVVITNVFSLQHISTAAAKKLLSEMKLGSNITEIPETGTIVVTEYAFRMQRIEDLLNLVDVPGPPKEFRLRVLKYTLAESLVPKVKALAEQLGTVDVTIGTSTPAAPAASARRGRRGRTPAPAPAPAAESAAKTGVFVDFDKRTNRVLMIGLNEEVAAVDKIIDSLDVPQQDLRVISEYEIQYVDIEKIVAALSELGIIEQTASGVGSRPAATARGKNAPGAPAAPTTPSPVSEDGPISLDMPQVVMLEFTNSLLVNATPEQHIQIAQIISYIDREPVQAAIPYRIYRLENQEPEALAEVLNNLIEKTVKDKEGKIQKTIKYSEEDIAIVPDENTFSLIVYASKKNQEWIGNLIESLDTRRPQVLIDVSLVEITRDDEFTFDLDVIATTAGLVSNNIGVTGALSSWVPQGYRFEGKYFDDTTNSAKGFFNEGSIQALFDIIDKKGYGRILARPKVLVNDNELGKIERIETEYVAHDSSIYSDQQTTTAPITTSRTYTPYQAKISLEITPQISEGDLLRLEIAMLREDFSETGTEGAPKDTTSSNINTIVTVPDGSTIILGGLTKLNQSKTDYKVPLLGDIPIAGGLFRKTSDVDKANKLYVFVKANILRPEETIGLGQLKQISRRNREEFEKAEKKFQLHEITPGIKPKPMDPERVLDRDEELEPLTILGK
ncbi:MAG: hypothetical protein JW806_05630 [Sedimentisphaerales bacterium]|nr:hypothetical protein [Sedimentisphaerales bacterium]